MGVYRHRVCRYKCSKINHKKRIEKKRKSNLDVKRPSCNKKDNIDTRCADTNIRCAKKNYLEKIFSCFSRHFLF
jgi:hypothetical protein